MKLIMENVKMFGYGLISFSKINRKFLLIIIFFVIFVADGERNKKIMLFHIDFFLIVYFFNFYIRNKKLVGVNLFFTGINNKATIYEILSVRSTKGCLFLLLWFCCCCFYRNKIYCCSSCYCFYYCYYYYYYYYLYYC